jgi:hypothetical protein
LHRVSTCAQVCQLMTWSIAAAVFSPIPSTFINSAFEAPKHADTVPKRSSKRAARSGPMLGRLCRTNVKLPSLLPLSFGLPVRQIVRVTQADQLGSDIKDQASGLSRVCGPEYGQVEYEHESNQGSLQGLSRYTQGRPFCVCPLDNVQVGPAKRIAIDGSHDARLHR